MTRYRKPSSLLLAAFCAAIGVWFALSTVRQLVRASEMGETTWTAEAQQAHVQPDRAPTAPVAATSPSQSHPPRVEDRSEPLAEYGRQIGPIFGDIRDRFQTFNTTLGDIQAGGDFDHDQLLTSEIPLAAINVDFDELRSLQPVPPEAREFHQTMLRAGDEQKGVSLSYARWIETRSEGDFAAMKQHMAVYDALIDQADAEMRQLTGGR